MGQQKALPMSIPPQPKPFQLDPPGLYVAPIAESFPGLVADQVTGLIQLRLLLQGGAELRLPLTNEPYQRLKDFFAEAPNAPGISKED